MADGPNIANAYVQLIPTMDGAQAQITKELGGEEAGTEAGNKIGSAIKKAIAAAGIGLAIKAAVDAGKKAWENINAVAEYGDQIDKTSQKVGLSTEAYQRWDYAMQISGSSMADCTVGLKTLTNTYDDAINGTDTAVEKFDRLGLSMDDLAGKSREDIFATVVGALQNVTDETEKAALANDFFGKSGQNLMPMFNMTNEQLAATMAEADEYGMIMSDDAVKAAAAFEDSLTKMKGTANGIKNRVFGALMPAVTSIMDGLSDSMAGFEGGTEKISSGINELVGQITEEIPYALDILAGIIPDVVGGLATAITSLDWGSIANSLMEAVNGLLEAAVTALPQLATVAMTLLSGLVTGLAKAAPTLLPMATEAILGTIQALFDNAPALVKAAILLLNGLIDGILKMVEVLLSPSGQATLESIINAIGEAVPMLIEAAFSILEKLLTYLIDNIDTLLPAAIQMVMTIIQGIGSSLGKILKAAYELLGKFLKGLADPVMLGKILNAGVTVVNEMISGVWSMLGGLWDAGMDIVRGIWSGISSGFGWIKDMISGWVGNVLDFIKGLFGIGSPSKVMADQVGQWLPAGLAEGIVDNSGIIDDAWGEVTDDMTATARVDMIAGSARIGQLQSAQLAQTARTMTPEQFAEAVARALLGVKVELDGREAGQFVRKTVLDAVYY